MSRVFWDTMLFVYLFENHATYGERVAKIRRRMLQRGDELYTSALAVGEILAGCYKKNDDGLADTFQRYFSGRDVAVLPFSIEAAGHFARLRAAMRVGAADAVHLACAANANVHVFITNDATLVGKIVPGVQFIVGLDTDLF